MLKTIEPDSSIAPFKYFILKVASLKYLYIALIILCFALAFAYNQFAKKVYEASASLSPVENKTSSLLRSNELFSSLTSLESMNNIENDMTNLNSFELVYSTVSEMNLEISYFREYKKIINQTDELFSYSPIKVSIDKSHNQPIDAKFYVTILDDNTYRLSVSGKKVAFYNYVDNQIVSEDNVVEFDTVCKFNETISNRLCSFTVGLNKANIDPSSKIQ
jgi:uncharacterized protein involved in exopolysaccharide biosynthesis